MGDHEGWAQPTGLLPNEAATVMQVLDMDRWSKVEERTAELIDCIQPNRSSEERRKAVADYVQQLIMKCFSCQVFTFGSVPLKTYLPDGDIDLTAFSKNQNLKDNWAQDVRDMLEKEEKSANAEFRVKEVQYIQAEVKIVKCLVENIVVDISFDQLGGLCTLCFLDEVDNLINHNHLFKRSIILIKAWCYYESRILGAHHGLISTYALETLVLYIFHVFNNSFAGPLEVLYRFLEFFSSFDWDNFCVSLWGPVRISSLPDMTAEPPRNDSGELLLSKIFLDACSSVYTVFPQENHSQPFVSKHFNVIDPLRTNNNLGRSVSKGNFFRIRSAFAFGARKLARVLECPKENMIAELNQFFMNTLERHGNGIRPDAPLPEQWPSRPISESENFRHQSGLKKKGGSMSPEFQAEGLVSFQGKPLQSIENASHFSERSQSSERMTRTTNTTAFSRTQSHKVHINQKNSNDLDQFTRPNESSQVEKNKLVNSSSHISGEPEYYGKNFFGRTRSSPELTDTATEGFSQGTSNQFLGSGKNHYISASSRRKNAISNEVPNASHRTRSSHDEHSALLPSLSNQSLETVVDLTNVSNSHLKDAVVPVDAEGLASETMDAHQEEQDFVNMMASPRLFNFDGQAQLPFNLVSHLPLPLSHSVLASMGYAQRNLPGVVPANVPLVDASWLPNGQPFPRGVTPSPVLHYIPSSGLTSNSEETFESGDESSGLVNAIQEDNDGVWRDQECSPTRHVNYENGNVQMVQTDEKQQPPSAAFSYISSRGNNFGSSHVIGQQNFGKESKGQIRDDSGDGLQPQSSHENDNYSSDRSSSVRYMPGLQTGNSRSKPSSESSWDGSSTRNSKAVRDKRGRKTSASSAPSTSYGKVKGALHREGPSSDRASSHTDDNRDWIPISTMSTETVERNSEPSSIVPSHLPSHQIAVYDNTQISGSDSVIPITPVLVNSNSTQRSMDGSGLVPIAFYPTIFFPIYNFHTETGHADSLASESDRDETIDSSGRISQSVENFDPVESFDQSEMFSSSSVKSFPEEAIEAHHKPDILNSDFASHWQNLQYGRLCQNTRHPGSVIYPPHVMLPQMYFPWEGPGRPISATNANQFAQFGYGHRLVPVSLQSGSSRPPTGGFQRYGDEPPRYRGGTGTYLPNPKVAYRERQSSHARSFRGNYHFERNDRGEREGSWNVGSKTRPPGRSHGRNHTEKQSLRAERSVASDTRNNRQWEPHKLDHSFNSYQVQTGPFSSTSSVHVPASAAYGMYGMPSVSTNGVTPTGPAVPNVSPVVMLYPYDPCVGGYGHQTDQLEFGSLGPVRFSGGDEGSQLADPTRAAYGRRHGTYPAESSECSSPDKPSTPQQVQRSATQRNYQLKEEDFPPLLFPNNGGENVSKRTTGHVSKPNHFRTFYYS